MLRLRSCASSMISVSYRRSIRSCWISASRMPSVISLTSGVLAGLVGEPDLVADRAARARRRAPRRSARRPSGRRSGAAGCARSCPRTPRPSSRQILGSWVVLPEPVSPATTTTWWSRIAARMSSLRAVTGSSLGVADRGDRGPPLRRPWPRPSRSPRPARPATPDPRTPSSRRRNRNSSRSVSSGSRARSSAREEDIPNVQRSRLTCDSATQFGRRRRWLSGRPGPGRSRRPRRRAGRAAGRRNVLSSRPRSVSRRSPSRAIVTAIASGSTSPCSTSAAPTPAAAAVSGGSASSASCRVSRCRRRCSCTSGRRGARRRERRQRLGPVAGQRRLARRDVLPRPGPVTCRHAGRSPFRPAFLQENDAGRKNRCHRGGEFDRRAR